MLCWRLWCSHDESLLLLDPAFCVLNHSYRQLVSLDSAVEKDTKSPLLWEGSLQSHSLWPSPRTPIPVSPIVHSTNPRGLSCLITPKRILLSSALWNSHYEISLWKSPNQDRSYFGNSMQKEDFGCKFHFLVISLAEFGTTVLLIKRKDCCICFLSSFALKLYICHTHYFPIIA